MSSNRVLWLSSDDPPDAFPDIEGALQEPDGLLAAGGDLGVDRLLHAYRSGIFPWFDEGQPILWWSPNPRCVLYPQEFHTSSRFRRTIATSSAKITINQSFDEVIRACAGPRRSEQGTWITAEMIAAYEALHADGWAHSIEIREDGALTGGLYGIAIDRMFFGESMFSGRSNMSKLALLCLCEILHANGFDMIDCQVVSRHLTTLGATAIPRAKFAAHLQSACSKTVRFENWPDSAIHARNLVPR